MSATSGIELRGIELRGIELRGRPQQDRAERDRAERDRAERDRAERDRAQWAAREVDRAEGIELRGIELRGCREVDRAEGNRAEGIELSGTPARARERRVTPLSFEPEIPKSEHGKLSEARVVHHCASAPEPGTVPARPIELSGKEPSSIELSGIELSGLDDRSRALRSTESKLAPAKAGLASGCGVLQDVLERHRLERHEGILAAGEDAVPARARVCRATVRVIGDPMSDSKALETPVLRL